MLNIDNGQWRLSWASSLSPKFFEQLSSSSSWNSLCCSCGGPSLHLLTDWFHPSLLFSRISPAPWAGESGEGLDGLAPMVPQTSKPMFHSFQTSSCENLFHKHVLHCTMCNLHIHGARIPAVILISTTFMFNVRHHLWKLEKTGGHFAIILSDCLFVFARLIDTL